MPASYTIDPDRKLVISRIWGAATNDEIREHNRRLRTDPLFDPSYRQLANMSEVTEVIVSTKTIQETARDQFFSPGTQRAFVAVDEAAFGLSRMYATIAESFDQTIEVFRERRAAEAWLGL